MDPSVSGRGEPQYPSRCIAEGEWLTTQAGPCSGTFNDAMPATVDIGEGTVRWRVYQDAAQFINNPKEGITVQGGTPLSCLGSYEYVVIDITAQEQQLPQRANAFSLLLRSPTAQTFCPLPGPAKSDNDNASTTIYRLLCKEMQTKRLYVETIANKTKVTALTRSLTAVLVSIDHHHSVLFLEVEEQKYWEQHKEKNAMNNKKVRMDWGQLEKRIAILTRDVQRCGEFLRSSRWESFAGQLRSPVEKRLPAG